MEAPGRVLTAMRLGQDQSPSKAACMAKPVIQLDEFCLHADNPAIFCQILGLVQCLGGFKKLLEKSRFHVVEM